MASPLTPFESYQAEEKSPYFWIYLANTTDITTVNLHFLKDHKKREVYHLPYNCF